MMNIEGELRPDFVIYDAKGNTVILEHFGMDNEDYVKRKNEKIEKYKKLCSKEDNFYFVSTNEDVMYNLKDSLGKKLNKTPLEKILWK